jgi:2-polyprenyl-3-methyl-5-hydroxy-6-metoxy-1,4-benzoquinol methylase
MKNSQLQRRCPLCDQDKSFPFWTKPGLELVQCANCSMTYANPVELELATGEFYDRKGVPFYLSPAKLESDFAPVRFEREVRCFREHCRKGAVLDVGCSTGAFLFALKTRYPGDYTVTGADVTRAAMDYAESRGIEVIRTPFLDLPETGHGFEAITFWAVMEHLFEPKRFLKKTAALLKPGGFCFILVPNMKSLAVRVLGV